MSFEGDDVGGDEDDDDEREDKDGGASVGRLIETGIGASASILSWFLFFFLDVTCEYATISSAELPLVQCCANSGYEISH
jgi:hypothetical protein